MPNNSKRLGEWAEAEFVARAMERGWEVFIPHGDSSQYDAIIAKGVLIQTIQIKSTFTKSLKDRSKWNLGRGTSTKKHYHRGVDFFALYCDTMKGWRFVTPAATKGQFTFSVKYTDTTTLDNWHALEE